MARGINNLIVTTSPWAYLPFQSKERAQGWSEREAAIELRDNSGAGGDCLTSLTLNLIPAEMVVEIGEPIAEHGRP